MAKMRRPKKPTLESIREKKFSEQIRGLKHLPHNDTIRRIDRKQFSLDANHLYRYKPEVLAGDEYKRCLELFERRLPEQSALPTQEAVATLQMQMQMTEDMMFTKEMRIHQELKDIAVDTIRSLFDIPEHVQILPEIKKDISLDPEEQDDNPEPFLSLSEDKKKDMWDEIQKRIILNGLVHGAAMHIWKSAHYIIKEKVDELDPQLMYLYDLYTTSISWLLWQLDPDVTQESIEAGGAITQGFNELEFDEPGEPEVNVHCHAVNFPVLLHEITKGAIDYLICHGIPEEYTEEQLEYYYAKSDDYSNEFFHYILSPTLWIRMVEAADVETQELSFVIARLTQLSYQELTQVLQACIDGQEIGHMKLKEMKIV